MAQDILGVLSLAGAIGAYVFIARNLLNKTRGHYEKW